MLFSPCSSETQVTSVVRMSFSFYNVVELIFVKENVRYERSLSDVVFPDLMSLVCYECLMTKIIVTQNFCVWQIEYILKFFEIVNHQNTYRKLTSRCKGK